MLQAKIRKLTYEAKYISQRMRQPFKYKNPKTQCQTAFQGFIQ